MKKEMVTHYLEKIPDLLNGVINYIGEEGDTLLKDVNGITGLILKVFTKPLINECTKAVEKNKLEEFGRNTYLMAALTQGKESFEYVNDDIRFKVLNGEVLKKIKTAFKNDTDKSTELLNTLRFDYTKHPIILKIKSIYKNIFNELGESDEVMSKFILHFNTNIEEQIKTKFGDSFNNHQISIENFWLKEKELDLLEDIKKLEKIGFQEDENLEYETTYAKWVEVTNYKSPHNEIDENEYSEINELIEEYFKNDEDNLDKILFIIADFGKGKSVFMKYLASQLAKEYLECMEGKFPIYINLREFSQYSDDSKLGLVSNFLIKKYQIDISEEHYKKREYVFLFDGLDESGELRAENIDKVIESIRRIQRLDMSICRKNRIIITSRPINEGLKSHLCKYKPKETIKEGCCPIPNYLSILGFKNEQVNNYIYKNLKKIVQDKSKYTNFSKKIIDSLEDQKINIAKMLIEDQVISADELRRPIFSYMMFQLIIKNIDFNKYGKIGIYMTFLNLLTKDAKHVKDINYNVSLKEEFEFRNILHAISALWMVERHTGNQGILKKSDICRTIKGNKIDDNDNVVLEKFKKIKDIQFLSHSYFGEDGNTLHFHHQSFAEILLAEYYLKAIIKYSLDKQSNAEELGMKLTLGEPTDQTMEFLTNLMIMLRESSVEEANEEILEKRKLLLPIIASLGIDQNNNLYSSHIDYTWNEKYMCDEYLSHINEEMLRDWPIKGKTIQKIIDTMYELFESDNTNLFVKGKQNSSLFNEEIYSINNYMVNSNLKIDKWIALLVGNTLYNDKNKEKFFNKKLKMENIISLWKDRNYTHGSSSPEWGNQLFNGLDFNHKDNDNYFNHQDNDVFFKRWNAINYLDLGEVDFSNSIFKNISFRNCNLYNSNFENSNLINISFFNCNCGYINFENVKIKNLELN
ncbi:MULTISPECIES: NACHT domain-containing protein, partial [Psychrilyobacter]